MASSSSKIPTSRYIQIGTIEQAIMNRMSLVDFVALNQQEALTVGNKMRDSMGTLSAICPSPIKNQIGRLNKQIADQGIIIGEAKEGLPC